jgi:hypothetical protein
VFPLFQSIAVLLAHLISDLVGCNLVDGVADEVQSKKPHTDNNLGISSALTVRVGGVAPVSQRTKSTQLSRTPRASKESCLQQQIAHISGSKNVPQNSFAERDVQNTRAQPTLCSCISAVLAVLIFTAYFFATNLK